MKLRAMIIAAVGVCFLSAGAQAARRPRRRPFKNWRDRVKREIDRARASGDRKPTVADMKAGGHGEKPVEWLTDFDEAAKMAAEQDRPMMVLFTTRQLMEKSRSCSFAANRVRRRVRESKVLPVRLLPPVKLSTKGIPKDEAKKREELYAKSRKRYMDLVKKYGINRGPCLVFCASDAKNLSSMLVPNDDQIEAGFDRLYDLVEAYKKTQPKKAGDAKGGDAPKGKDAPAKGKGGDAKKGGDQPPEEKKKPVDPEEDF
jgi:hypothetical protein